MVKVRRFLLVLSLALCLFTDASESFSCAFGYPAETSFMGSFSNSVNCDTNSISTTEKDYYWNSPEKKDLRIEAEWVSSDSFPLWRRSSSNFWELSIYLFNLSSFVSWLQFALEISKFLSWATILKWKRSQHCGRFMLQHFRMSNSTELTDLIYWIVSVSFKTLNRISFIK